MRTRIATTVLKLGLVVAVLGTAGQTHAQCNYSTEGSLASTQMGASDGWGSATSVDGSLAVIGAKNGRLNGVPHGLASVFRKTTNGWVHESLLTPDTGASGDQFGGAVAISGDWAFVAAPFANQYRGKVCVYKRVSVGNWQRTQVIVAPVAAMGDFFGRSVAISGTVAAIGTGDYAGPGRGAVHVYNLVSGNWNAQQKLVPAATSGFGTSVSISGNWLVAGAAYETWGGRTYAGAAYAYQLSGSTWVERQRIAPSDLMNYDYLGLSIAISNNLMVVGAPSDAAYGPGSAYAFTLSGSTWVQTQPRMMRLWANNGDRFGESVGISSSVLAVGSPRRAAGPSGAGEVAVYVPQSGTWGQVSYVRPSTLTLWGYFGASVGVSGTEVMAGEPGSNSINYMAGTAWVCSSNCNSPVAPAVTISNPINNSSFASGATVSFSGSAIDQQQGNISSSLTWTSNLQGQIGTGPSFTRNNLASGTHTITAQCTNSAGLTGSATVQLIILAGNTAPAVAISSPSNNSSHLAGANITFTGSAIDLEQGNLSSQLVWTSNLQGFLGVGASFIRNDLVTGTHTITAQCTDTGGLQGSASTQITVSPSASAPPVVAITTPTSGSSFSFGQFVSFTGTASDSNGNLSAYLTWTSNLQGQFGAGAIVNYNGLVAGTHTITARCVSPFTGLSSTASIWLTIQQSTNTAPSVVILGPANNAPNLTTNSVITFSGAASDTQDGNISSNLIWTSNLQGQIGTGASFSRTLVAGSHTITARATDSGGLQGSASITLIVSAPTNQTFTFSGTLKKNSASATHSLNATKAGTITNLLSNGSGSGTVRISILNSSNVVLASNTGTAGMTVSANVPAAGVYRVRIERITGTGNFAYTMTVTAP